MLAPEPPAAPALVGPGGSVYPRSLGGVRMLYDEAQWGRYLTIVGRNLAALPRRHVVRIDGVRRKDGMMMWLKSDPYRPTNVYQLRGGL